MAAGTLTDLVAAFDDLLDGAPKVPLAPQVMVKRRDARRFVDAMRAAPDAAGRAAPLIEELARAIAAAPSVPLTPSVRLDAERTREILSGIRAEAARDPEVPL